jgi:hypothetical protein
MKTKLMVLALMAGGSMFAATRVTFGVSVGSRVDPYCAPAPVYNSYSGYSSGYGYNTYVAPSYNQRFDRRVVVNTRRDWDHDRDDHRNVRRDRDDNRFSNSFRRR